MDAPDHEEGEADVDVDDGVRTFTMPEEETEDDPKPLRFKLAGMTLPGKDVPSKPWSETFTVLRHLPPGALRDLALSARVNGDGDVEWDRYATLRFMRAVIIPDDEARWDALMHDKRRPCKLDLIGECMFYVTETKAARPTGPQRGSRATTAGTNGGSGKGSGSRVGKPRSKTGKQRS